MRRYLLSVLWLATAAVADPVLEAEHALRADFVTPHTVWAKPWAAGPVRVLYFGDHHHARPREMVELLQRFDFSAEAVYWGTIVDTTISGWHGGDEGVARIRRLLGQPFDVYLFHAAQLEKLPVELQYQLLQRVTAGAGLVFLGGDDQRVLKRPLKAQPGDPEADLFSVRDGRAARLPAPPIIEYRFGWEVEYDLWQQRVGRAILWAAGKLPQPRPLAWQKPAGTQDQVLLLRALPAGSRLTGRLRRADGRIYAAGELQPQAGQVVHLPRPHLPAGEYHWDLQLRSAKGVEDWTVVPLSVATARTVTVAPARPYAEIGETIAGQVELGGAPLAGERVSLEVSDRRGRLLLTTPPAAPTGGRVPFAFQVADWLPMLVQVRAVVATAQGEVADGVAYVNVTKRHRGRFNFLMWDYPKGPAGTWGIEALSRLGVSLVLTGSGQTTPHRSLAAYELPCVPYTTRILDPKNAQGHLQPVTWNLEPAIDEYVGQLAAKYAPMRQHGVFVYSLGDETVTRGSDTSPSDLAAYQAFLKESYQTIAALNASWGTSFQQWSDIALLDPTDSRESKAKADGQYARWYDRQAWECRNFVNLCERFGDAYRTLDPQARTGFEGAGRFGAGDDIDSLVRTNGFWSPYPGPADLVIRDIAPRDFPRANWMGYTKDAVSLGHKYWRMILNGCDSVWWWRWDGLGRFNGVLLPTLAPFDHVAELFADTRITREGLGDLLLRYPLQHDGIAMLYSMPSAYACQLADGPSYGNYEAPHLAWHRALFNLGLNVHYLTDAMLRRGELDAKAFKVLILPRTEALSDAEAKVIRDFVAAGGTVIADLRPGRYNEHCRPRQAGALDDLFGVDSSGSAAAKLDVTAKLSLDPLPVGRPRREVEVTGATIDPGLKVAGAMALGQAGEAPALLDHGVGPGRAVLLNLAVDPLGRAANPAGGETWATTLVGALLARAGVQPAVRLRRAAGAVGDLQMVRWRGRSAEVVAILPAERNAPETATVELDRAVRALDVRTGRDLGHGQRFEVGLRPGSGTVLALLPGDPPRVRASVQPARAARGATATLNLGVDGLADEGAVLVTATRPDGSDADWLRQVVVIPAGGVAQVPVPVALNDPLGAWRLTVRELFTQAETNLTLTVIGRE